MSSDLLPNLGFLGYGKMAEAISGAILSTDPSWPRFAFDPYRDKLSATIEQVGSAEELEEKSDIVLICVKPQDMQKATSVLKGNKNYISIAAGLKTETLKSYFPCENRIARVMPNLCASIGLSVNAIFCEDESLYNQVDRVFASSGMNVPIQKEDLMHAVTGLSGSGPAFALLAIEAMAQAGIYEGLPSQDAIRMAAQTVKGAAELVLQSSEVPASLIHNVTSPGGTTIRGVRALEDGGLKPAMMNAVIAAANRSRELS